MGLDGCFVLRAFQPTDSTLLDSLVLTLADLEQLGDPFGSGVIGVPPLPNLVFGDVVAAARDARMHALNVQLRGLEPDVPDADAVAGRGSLLQEPGDRATSERRLEGVARPGRSGGVRPPRLVHRR